MGFAKNCPTMKTQNLDNDGDRDLNKDPITGEPGSHPIGTGIGAAGAGAAGVAIGALGGPVGAAIGGVIGAIAGAAAGHGVAESVNPTEEEAYWSESYRDEPYYEEGEVFEDYDPAYRLGYERYHGFQGRTYDEAESELENDWNDTKGDSRLSWDKAKLAARAGWERVQHSFDGKNDKS